MAFDTGFGLFSFFHGVELGGLPILVHTQKLD